MYQEIFAKVDHTLLKPTSTEQEIIAILQEAHTNNCFSACIPPSYVAFAKDYFQKLGSQTKVCTVIGFPLGYNTTAVKVFETEDAIKNGADEIDMVINQGWLKDKKYQEIKEEIQQIKQICAEKILKVIVETCNLSSTEIAQITQIVDESGADFIKTSTGFAAAGAKIEDIVIFKENINPNRKPVLKIKAAGGMKTKEDILRFVENGIDRLGTSKAVGLFKNSTEQLEQKTSKETDY